MVREATTQRSDNETPSQETGYDLERTPGSQELDPERWMRGQRRVDTTLSIGVPVLLVLAWQLAATTGLIDDRFFGSPARVVARAGELISDGTLLDNVLISMFRVLSGYLIGAVTGLVVGLTLGQSRLLRAAFGPVLSAFYVVPKLAILPILLLLFGIGETPKILLVAISVFFIVAISSMSSAIMTPPGYLEVAKSFEASRWQQFKFVVLPSVMPQLFTALRLASGIAVLMLVAAEFVNAQEGLGYLIWHSWSLFLADQMYVGIVTVALLGVIFGWVVTKLGQAIAPWAPRGDLKDEVV